MDYPDNIESICNETWPLVYKYVYYKVNNEDDAKDIVQETYLKAIGNINNIKEMKSFLPYLKSVAKNIIIDRHRKKKISERDFNELNEGIVSDGNISLDDHVIKDEEKNHLYSCLLMLHENYRTVLELRIIEGLSLKECSKILGKSTSSIKNIQYRAVIKLRELFKEV